MNEYEKSKFEWLLTFENEATIKRYKSTLRKFDSFLLKITITWIMLKIWSLQV